MRVKKYKNYVEYKKIQIQRTKEKINQDNIGKHKMVFDWFFSKAKIKSSIFILCVGARAGNEIAALNDRGFYNIVGTDLYPTKDIIFDDMNDMQFEDNSFDMIYSHHSLEHTIHPGKAANEMQRVVKPGGIIFIVVPIMKTDRISECVSFSHPREVESLFGKCSILGKEFLKSNTKSNNNPEFRCIFTKTKI